MNNPARAKGTLSASIKLGEAEARIEKLPLEEGKPAQIRLSLWSQGKMQRRPLSLTEEALIDLLQAALRDGILSSDFIAELRKAIEI